MMLRDFISTVLVVDNFDWGKQILYELYTYIGIYVCTIHCRELYNILMIERPDDVYTQYIIEVMLYEYQNNK